MLLKKIVAFIVLVLVLAALSAIDLYYSNNLFIDPLNKKGFTDVLVISFTIIPLTSIIYLILQKKLKYWSYLQQGFTCILINLLLLFIITLPLVGFITGKDLLWHLMGVTIFCFSIPYAYNIIKKLLDMPIDRAVS
ncbi:MAG: hypothetical protein ABIN13_01485 [Mucilaginibacter sp.]